MNRTFTFVSEVRPPSDHDGRLIVGTTTGQMYSVAIYNIGSGMWAESLYGYVVDTHSSRETDNNDQANTHVPRIICDVLLSERA